MNPTAPSARTNRLVREKSPYLLQHARNPVDWYAWGEEAFEKARRENKPIFLSIGYSTCHWCHVMERESFENAPVAEFLNAHFVSIKVDREERPDVDKIYMTFVQATTGAGGWPMSVFLTPELKPFFGGTYFPPDSRYGRPGFLQLLQHLHQLCGEEDRIQIILLLVGRPLEDRADAAANGLEQFGAVAKQQGPSRGTADNQHFMRNGVKNRLKMTAGDGEPPKHHAEKHDRSSAWSASIYHLAQNINLNNISRFRVI